MISGVLIRRFCYISPSIAEIVALSISTWVCPGCSKSLIYGSAFVTLTLPEYDAPYETPFSVRVHRFYPSINLGSMLPFCIKKLNNCLLCWFERMHRASNCGNSPEMRILLRSGQVHMCSRKYYNAIYQQTHYDWYLYNELQLKSSFHLGINYKSYFCVKMISDISLTQIIFPHCHRDDFDLNCICMQ